LPAARPSHDDQPGESPLVVRVAKDVFQRFQDHHLTHHAAALTYYGLLSLFPAALIGVLLLGLLGQESTVEDVARYLTEQGAPRATVEAVRSSIRTAVTSRSGTAAPLLAVTILVALYGASGAFAAAGQALNAVLETEEERPFLRRKPVEIAATLLLIVLVAGALILIFVGGGLARQLFAAIGLGGTAASIWNVARWPGALLVTMVIYAFVYWAAPDDRGRKFRWFSPGAALGVLIWLAASAGFFVYVSNFGSYNATYGAFATVVILLVWLWLTNVALLLGAEVNASLDRLRSPALDPAARLAREAQEAAS
jgi:membrane protein